MNGLLNYTPEQLNRLGLLAQQDLTTGTINPSNPNMVDKAQGLLAQGFMKMGYNPRDAYAQANKWISTQGDMGAADFVPLAGDLIGAQDAYDMGGEAKNAFNREEYLKALGYGAGSAATGILSGIGALATVAPPLDKGIDAARVGVKKATGLLDNTPRTGAELAENNSQIDAIEPHTTSAGYSFDPSMTARNQLERIPDETFDVDADVIYDGARRYKDSTRDDINKRLSERGLTISSVNDSRASESQYWNVAPLSDPDDLIGTVRFSDHPDFFGGNDVDIRWGQKPDEITSDILEKINLDNYVPFDERVNGLPPTTIVPKPFVATTDIGLNDIVSHDKFGRGKILSVDGNKAEVLFDDGKTKMMNSSYLTTINKPKISDELVDAVVKQNQIDAIEKSGAVKSATKYDTPEFKNWFGDSKVVDEAGKPLTVYHGTNKKFDEFDADKSIGGQHWFTNKKSEIDAGNVGASGSGEVMEVNLSLQNPAGWDEYDRLSIGQLIDEGYDGLKLPDADGQITYVAFEPTQIKSIHNKGKYNPKDANILNSIAPIAGAGLLGATAMSQQENQQQPTGILQY
jgi:hypothetical protein